MTRRRATQGSTLIAGAVAIVIAALLLAVREVRRVPRPTHDPQEPAPSLTDIAPAAARPLAPRGARPLAPRADEATPEALPEPVVLPTEFDVTAPPLLTAPLAVPGEPTPPDPFVEPVIAQDPDRGRRGDGAR